MTSSHFVTPTLFVGGPPNFDDVERVSTVEEATRVIYAGRTAVLPDEAWALAEQVLAALGLDDRMIEERVHFARTGEILYGI